jgi:hypothetical protein
MRVTSSIWVAAHLRRCFAAGAFALIERKGAEEAGAIYLRADLPDGTSKLFFPAPQSVYEGGSFERKWEAYKNGALLSAAEARAALARETRIDSDAWIIVIEDREGQSFLPKDLLI